MEIEKNKLYWFFLASFFIILALPLLNLPPLFSPPAWGKVIVFRIVLSILALFAIWLILRSGNFSLKTSVSSWLLIALLICSFLATLFSVDKRFSFWGSPYRAGGFLNFAFYIIFALLAFLIIEKEDWRKIWDLAIFIGILVSFIALLQYFNFLSQAVIPYEQNPPSTLGNSAFLAVYLLLLSFLALSFGLKEEEKNKKIFYFGGLFLFLFVILITEARAAYLGLLAGFFYFLFFYPKKIKWLRILTFVVLVLMITLIYYVNVQPGLPEFIQNNRILKTVASRLSVQLLLKEARFSGWKISFQAIKEKPILGWGPENFSIGFDKYYDPSLPELAGTWWDRAHNFIFDIGVTTGLPALLVYISLFLVLFWQLQKLKKDFIEQVLICHGIQATLLAYLIADLFSFDTFSTYLISFLLIGFSLSLISEDIPEKTFSFNIKGKKLIISFLLGLTIWFIWAFNIRPLSINKEIKTARSQVKLKDYQGGLKRIEEQFRTHTCLDNYLRLNYIEISNEYLEKATPLAQSLVIDTAIKALKENIKIRPLYTRNWLLLGNYTNILIEKGEKSLREEANSYFEKASELSPKRPEIFISWTKTNYLANDFLTAKEKAQNCIDINPEAIECWWLMGLINVNLGEKEKAKASIEIAEQKGYSVESEGSLIQLAAAYNNIKDYEESIGIYKELTRIKPTNAQYHATLAVLYKEVGDFKKAREEILIAQDLAPEAKEQIEEFLEELK